ETHIDRLSMSLLSESHRDFLAYPMRIVSFSWVVLLPVAMIALTVKKMIAPPETEKKALRLGTQRGMMEGTLISIPSSEGQKDHSSTGRATIPLWCMSCGMLAAGGSVWRTTRTRSLE